MRTLARMIASTSGAQGRRSMRYPTYCSALSPTMTRRPQRDAISRSARGGVVWGMRTALIPFAAIWAKSRSTVARSWYSFPAASGVNAPYVTPRTYSFSSPTKRNLPRTQGRGVGWRDGPGTRAGATAAPARSAVSCRTASLRSGLSLVEPPVWLGTMRRMSLPRAVVCERRSKLAVCQQAVCRVQEELEGLRELHEQNGGKVCHDCVKDVQLDRRDPAAAWPLAQSCASCRIAAVALTHRPENPRALARYLTDA